MTTTCAPELPGELDDLGLLDDSRRHAVCPGCNPTYTPGQPFVAICGRRAVSFRRAVHLIPPPDACPECITAASRRRCGH